MGDEKKRERKKREHSEESRESRLCGVNRGLTNDKQKELRILRGIGRGPLNRAGCTYFCVTRVKTRGGDSAARAERDHAGLFEEEG